MERIKFDSIEDILEGCYCTLISLPSWDEDVVYVIDYANHKALRGYLVEDSLLKLRDIVTINDQEIAELLHDASIWGGYMTSKPYFNPRLDTVTPAAFIIRLY